MRDLISRYKADVNLKLESRSQGDDELSKCVTYKYLLVFSPESFT